MVFIEYTDSKLKIGDEEIDLRHSVDTCLECDDVVIVLLEAPSGTTDDTNIVGFNKSGEQLWEIEPPNTSQKCQPYMTLEERDGEIVTQNWNGYSYKINIENGSIEPFHYSSK